MSKDKVIVEKSKGSSPNQKADGLRYNKLAQKVKINRRFRRSLAEQRLTIERLTDLMTDASTVRRASLQKQKEAAMRLQVETRGRFSVSQMGLVALLGELILDPIKSPWFLYLTQEEIKAMLEAP